MPKTTSFEQLEFDLSPKCSRCLEPAGHFFSGLRFCSACWKELLAWLGGGQTSSQNGMKLTKKVVNVWNAEMNCFETKEVLTREEEK